MAQFSQRVSASADDMGVYETGAAHPPWDSTAGIDQTYGGAGFEDIYGVYYIGYGFRWQNVTVPAGSTVTSAYIKLTADISRSANSTNTVIDGDDSDSASAFSTIADYNGRSRTTASVAWTGIAAWTAGVEYTSPDIKTVVQEIIDRGGWASGNDMVIFWEDNGTSTSWRTCDTWDGDSADAALLEINYTPPAAGATVPVLVHSTRHIISKIVRG